MTEEVYSDDFSEEENILQVVNKEQELVAKTNTNGLKGKTTTKKFASSHFHLPASTSVPSQPRISNIVEEKMLARRLAEEKRRLANAKATIECRASSSTPIGWRYVRIHRTCERQFEILQGNDFMLDKIRNARSSIECHRARDGPNLEHSSKHRRSQIQRTIESRNKSLSERIASVAVEIFCI
mmetsp:Transcript_17917/g.40645  ORF Transcript_17917/g.40645 Transcript_17917/m.40645 type:complete len:183 (-) Transcript_17917:4-552(-)